MNFIDLLLNGAGNPLLYSFLFFIYVVLAALILPIPVEIGLFNPFIHPVLLIAILALGKGTGSLIVFLIGSKIRKKIKKWSIGTPQTKKIIAYCEKFVKKYGYAGLLLIMSIPLMMDSITLYLFSLLNPQEDGKTALTKSKFVFINIIAGAIRGTIVLTVASFFGYRLV